jgi:excisionase family DNA binding protein
MTNSKNIPEEFYTAQEVADMLKVNIMTIYRYINSGKLDAYKFGKEFRIEKNVWKDFLNDNKVK